MRCLSCHKLSFRVICEACEAKLLIPTISKRKVGTLEVVSLFRYSTLEPFLLTKHTAAGYRLYRYFSKQFLKSFLDDFASHIDEPVTLIGVDERSGGGYSHTALLSHHASSPKIRAIHSKLLAQNPVKYAGRSLQFRLENPREFRYTGETGIEAILIDDIITTGVTLQEAQQELERHGVEVLFALTLADARE